MPGTSGGETSQKNPADKKGDDNSAPSDDHSAAGDGNSAGSRGDAHTAVPSSNAAG